MKKFILFGTIGVIIIGGIVFAVVMLKKGDNGSEPNVVSQDQDTNKNSNQAPGVVRTPTTTEPAPVVDLFPHDKDRDGLLDTEEEKLGLSDSEFDSDNDGINDTDEINTFKTDPKKKDTDADGYADGYEVSNGFNPNGEGKLSIEPPPEEPET